MKEYKVRVIFKAEHQSMNDQRNFTINADGFYFKQGMVVFYKDSYQHITEIVAMFPMDKMMITDVKPLPPTEPYSETFGEPTS